MSDHLFFLFYLLFFLSSLIGYGFLFLSFFERNLLKLNLGYIGIIGFFFSILISVVTSFFLSHDFIHNSVFHLIGFIFLLLNLKKITINELKICAVVYILLLVGIYIFKNHDDFPYYHLTYSLNLSENSFLIGTGAFSHGFRTPSSLFYFHSLLYMPNIKFYLFHSGPFYILYFFNLTIIFDIYKKIKYKNFDLTYYLGLSCLIFVNIVFYRLSEHGTDRSSQILLVLIFIVFFEILFLKNNQKDSLINLFLLLITLAASIKVLYNIYFILIFFLIYEKKIKYYKIFKNFSYLFLLFVFSSLFASKNFFSTGCLVYPAEKTCFESFPWSVKKDEVKKLNIHYEWWSKSGGSANYKNKMPKDEYVKSFNWLHNWYKRHFIGKVTDTIGAIALISIILFLTFKSKHRKKFKKKSYRFYSLLPLFFLVEWFWNHPSMRYGGYILFALPVFIYLSDYLDKDKTDFKKIYKSTVILIAITFVSYNLRNVDRIRNEISIYNYDIVKSPYFFVDNVKSEIITEYDKIKIYKPVNNMCWASKTPCSYNINININYKNKFYFITEND